MKITDIRRLYNSLGQTLDRQALREEIHDIHRLDDSTSPITAGQAFKQIIPVVKEIDSKPKLKLISAAGTIQTDGSATRWEFFFDLPKKRAKLECGWYLQWDDSEDDYHGAQIELRAQPFPTADNPLRQMVDQGELLYQQLDGLWQQERKRSPDLPAKFRDSDAVIRELADQDIDLLKHELSLSTGVNARGKTCWLVQTRSESFQLDL